MRIAFLSNFYNHHQKPISDHLYRLTNGDYRFIATTRVPDERKALGYHDETPSYVLKSYAADDASEARRWIDEADVVISGFVGEELLRQRIRDKKPILRYSERPLKNGFEWHKYPYRFLQWRRENPQNAPIYLLCAGAYTASDYAAFGLFRSKALKWGYFPAIHTYDAERLIEEKDKREILWCGRFLDWKHPDDALRAAGRLKKDGVDFHLSFIGGGEMEKELHRLCAALQLEDRVSFLGAMSPEEVRRRMEKAGVFLLTSDRKEGWGAVLNEAMNGGCAVVATEEAGSTPYLIKDQVNGMIYRAGDIGALTGRIGQFLRCPGEQERLGKAAYQTICDEWNPKIAAERLINVCGAILKGEDFTSIYSSGPCSRA